MNWHFEQRIDLRHPVGALNWPDLTMVQGDHLAHEWRVWVNDGGAAADLSGYRAMGYFMRSDGVTVPVEGTISGNKATVALPQAVYACKGPLGGLLRAERDGQVVTLACGRWLVRCGVTDDVADPEHVISGLTQVPEKLEELERLMTETAAAKVDKDQGVSNAGKLLGIDANGQVTPVGTPISGGGTSSGNAPALDATLTLSGAAADAKAVGDALADRMSKNQGADNAGKVLSIDANGQVTPVDAPTSGGGLPTVYCWGDSLTEGVGGWVDTLDKVQKAIVSAYPDVVANTYPCVNLGCRGETIQTIMARQGADPMVVGGVTIPASASENVVVGYLRGNYYDENRLGLATKSGDVAQPLKECEAGVNPCVIAGVEGTLYRDMTPDSEGRYAYRFRRLEDGEAVAVPEGTEVETYAMRHYRNGVAVIWMGANGAVNSHTAYIDKVKQMVAYGNYSNYLLVVAREYTAQWVLEDSNSIRLAMMDGDGVCHLLYLPPELVRRGYTLAGIAASAGAVDTSGWTNTTDLIKKNAPLLMYTPGGTAESSFETLHFSPYGYKAIGKLVVEKLGQLIGVSSGTGGSGSGGTVTPENPGYVKDGTDDWGDYSFKLTRARRGLGSVFNTGVQLFETEKDWTIFCRFADGMAVSDGSLGSVFELRQFFAEESKQTAAFLRLLPQTDGTMKYNFGGGFGGFDFPFDNAPGYAEPTDGYHTAVIAKQGSNYEFYLDGGKAFNSPLNYEVAAEHLTEESLYLFGRMESGTALNTVTGQIADFRVYKQYMNPTAVAALVAEMNG